MTKFLARPLARPIANSLSGDSNGATLLEGDFYVDGVNGLDTNDGTTRETAWKTIGKALRSGPDAGADKSVVVLAGNYYDEGEVATVFNILGGNTLTLTAEGTVRVRKSESTVYGGWAWWENASSNGTLKFVGFTFEQGLEGDGTPNANYMINGNNSATLAYVFESCEIDGNGENTRFIGTGVTNLQFFKCHIHDFANYLALVKGTHKLHSCYIHDCTSALWGFNPMTLLEVIHCTFVNAIISPTAGTTHTTVRIKNTHFSHNAQPVQIDTIGTLDESNNSFYRLGTPPSPRTHGWYVGLAFIMDDTTNIYDTSLWADPDFATAPALNSTSLLIQRGVAGTGVTEDINGKTFSNPPPIGCVNHSGAKQYITATSNQIAIGGDSFVSGAGGGPTTRMTAVVEAYQSGKTFLKMPGGASYDHLGIYGSPVSRIFHFLQDRIAVEGAELALILGGFNDHPNFSDADLAQGIKDAIDRTADLGVDLLFCGVQAWDADAVAPDYLDSIAIEDEIATYCESQGYPDPIRSTALITAEAGWNSDSIPPGLFVMDDIHPNNDGHAFYGGLMNDAIDAYYGA